MGMNKSPVILLLTVVIMIVSIGGKPSCAEGRTLSLLSHQGYSKILGTLGVICKCCDGIHGACRDTWTDSCSNLKCSPWKSVHAG